VLFIRNNDKAKRYVEKLQKRMNKPMALSTLAHKLGRAAYFMLKDKPDYAYDSAIFNSRYGIGGVRAATVRKRGIMALRS